MEHRKREVDTNIRLYITMRLEMKKKRKDTYALRGGGVGTRFEF